MMAVKTRCVEVRLATRNYCINVYIQAKKKKKEIKTIR